MRCKYINISIYKEIKRSRREQSKIKEDKDWFFIKYINYFRYKIIILMSSWLMLKNILIWRKSRLTYKIKAFRLL